MISRKKKLAISQKSKRNAKKTSQSSVDDKNGWFYDKHGNVKYSTILSGGTHYGGIINVGFMPHLRNKMK